MRITKTNLQETSLIRNFAFDYIDSYSADIKAKDLTIEQVGKSFFTASPGWVNGLLRLRDKIVGLFGFKTGSNERDPQALIKNFSCEIGEQIALFRVLDKSINEIIFGEDDKHLNFRVSLLLDRKRDSLTLSTLVKFNNWMGRLYFIPVLPFHKIIIHIVIKRMIEQLQNSKIQ